MKWMDQIARRVGLRMLPVTAWAVVALLVLGGGAVSILASAPATWGAGIQDGVTRVEVADDSDGDGLPDALENRIGSDRDEIHTLGAGVPDGWLYHWYGDAVDWNDTSLLDSAALRAPTGVLPEPLQDSDRMPSINVSDVYRLDASLRDPEGIRGAWWLADAAIDPRGWDNDGDDIADAWLLGHGLDPLAANPDEPSPGDPAMSLREKYTQGLDPRSTDTDGDGLHDLEEIQGELLLQGVSRRFEPTDPLRPSSRGDGIADGYLVWHGLDASDAGVGRLSPAGDGLSVSDAYTISEDHCLATRESPCPWRTALRDGDVVDPTTWDTLGDGVADAWSAQDPHGIAHPLEHATATILDDTAQWDDQPWDGDATRLRGLVIDSANPEPVSQELDLLDAYSYRRPADWHETRDGPWRNGLPTRITSPDGGLPAAVALRGWVLQVDAGLGRNNSQAVPADALVEAVAAADPRSADTDGDGLTDEMEYYGITPDGEPGHRTDPSNADTDGDGLSDAEEASASGYQTHPLRIDTSGSFLTDGEEVAYWQSRQDDAIEALATLSPGQALDAYGWLLRPGEAVLRPEHVSRLAPGGSLLPDGIPNVLARDADGDGLPDGAELRPNDHLGVPSSHDRPATDPARRDSDGDRLPDAWEIRWSQDRYYGCKTPCTSAKAILTWPIDPSKWNSMDPDDLVRSDWDVNLAGDEVKTSADDPPRTFSNGLAYKYDLHPFQNDTSPSDGIRDMFALHWGVEAPAHGVPDWVVDAVREDPDAFGWALEAADRTADSLANAGFPGEAPEVVIIDPRSASTPVDSSTNLLDVFSDRRKGTWVLQEDRTASDTSCREPLPATGDRRETGVDGLTDRDLVACWQWIDHPLRFDLHNGTNPWQHDFDGDGLPDAWEMYYGDGDLLADQLTPGSTEEGKCMDTARHAGLPTLEELGRKTYCLTFLESYRMGLDPRSADSDRGGIEDWVEIAISALDPPGQESLDPLDPRDDRGDEDWDGDGLLNREESLLGTSLLSPDTDGDGLLDGVREAGVVADEPPFVAEGQGRGDMCLRRGSDPVPRMEHRPFSKGLGSGPLTHTQRFEHFVSLGLLHEPADQVDRSGGRACRDMTGPDGTPVSHHLFKREAMADEWTTPGSVVVIGAGQGTDSLSLDTSGDGLPDGWLVYWRDRAGQSGSLRTALDPNAPGGVAQENPEKDLPNIVEYRSSRPVDWLESRDGPWWGGLSPISKDTDGDGEWFESTTSGQDSLDLDNDADGIPDAIDAFPAIDVQNAGIVQADGEGGYVTDYNALWQELAGRPTFALRDGDADGVPDFLDRARVTVVDLEILRGNDAVTSVEKRGELFDVAGRVLLDETPLDGVTYEGPGAPAGAAEGGDPVGGATVKAIVDDGSTQAVLGYGFTGSDGRFLIRAALDDAATGTPGAGTASVDGRLVDASDPPPIASEALDLAPGPVRLRVVVEPNHPNVQEIGFGGATVAAVYKDMEPDPFRIPTDDPDGAGPALRAVVLDADGPNASAKHIAHASDAVFPATSARVDLTLRSPVDLTSAPLKTRVRVGEPVFFVGDLTDPNGVPLPGRDVTVTLEDSLEGALALPTSTDDEGRFNATFDDLDSGRVDPGTHTFRVHVDLDDDAFLIPPPDQLHGIQFVQDTVWADTAQLADRTVPRSGTVRDLDATQPIHIHADLLDAVTGDPAEGRAVEVRLLTLHGNEEVDATTVTSDADGVRATIGPPSGSAPLQPLLLIASVLPLTAAEETAEATFTVEFAYPTTVAAQDVRVAVGETEHVKGTLHRQTSTGPVPVHDPDASFLITTPDGDPLEALGTDATGSFRFPVGSETPGNVTWTITYLGDTAGMLAKSPPATAVSTHFAHTRLDADAPVALVGDEVPLTVVLTREEDGSPAGGARIVAVWADPADPINATTGPAGHAMLPLPPRTTPGQHVVDVSFAGNATHDPAAQQIEVTVQERTAFNVSVEPMRMDSNGTRRGSVEAILLAGEKDPLSLRGRAVEVTISDPTGQTRSIGRVTDTRGAVEIRPHEMGPPVAGNWTVDLAYGGAPLEAAAAISVEVPSVHEAQIRIDRATQRVTPGQTAVVGGTLESAAGPVAGAEVVAEVDGAFVARGTSGPDGIWSLHFRVPSLTVGNHSLVVRGVELDHHELLGDSADIFLVKPVEATVEEETGSEGRVFRIHLKEHGTTHPVGDTEVVLALLDETGQVREIYHVTTDENGEATLRLEAGPAGSLEALAVTDPHLQLVPAGETDIQTRLVTVGDSRSVMPALAAAGGAVLAGLATLAYLLWRRRHRAALGSIFDDAHLSLLDPDASHAEVIHRAYQRLLLHLEDAGHAVRDQDTPRDVARQATRAFGLPRGPMQAITALFERVVYADRPMGPPQRLRAIDAFHALAHELTGRPTNPRKPPEAMHE